MVLLTCATTTCVITHAKSIFARHGIPDTVVSDNGSCPDTKVGQQFAEHVASGMKPLVHIIQSVMEKLRKQFSQEGRQMRAVQVLVWLHAATEHQ